MTIYDLKETRNHFEAEYLSKHLNMSDAEKKLFDILMTLLDDFIIEVEKRINATAK